MKWALFGVLALGVAGCCSWPECHDRASTHDRARQGAKKVVAYDKVINDSVSAPDRDRTDWRWLTVPSKGTLTAELHWDKSGQQLELSVFDAMGMKIQDGRPWGVGGQRTVIAVEEPGKYYVRVRARGEDDGSTYALRLRFEKKGVAVECVECTVGEKKCLGEDGVVACEQKSADCMVWAKPVPCEEGQKCEEGECKGKSCNKCPPGARRCAGGSKFQVCAKEGDCFDWSSPRSCGRKRVCRGAGVCGGKGGDGKKPPPPPPPPPPPGGCISGTIISMYNYRGRPTLHIRVGENSGVQAGFTGHVLQGKTKKRLPDGTFKVTRVSGKYCIATTSLENLGLNRSVCINKAE